jgi:predicted permease
MQAHLPTLDLDAQRLAVQRFERLYPELATLPGVSSVAATVGLPMSDLGSNGLYAVEGKHTFAPGVELPQANFRLASPGYFRTMGIPVVRGRDFSAVDGEDGQFVAIISEALARQTFPGEDPIGRQLRFVPRLDEPDAPPQPWRTIVGVVPTFQQGNDSDTFRNTVVYLPFLHAPDRFSSLIVRSTLPPASVMAAVRSVVQSIDADQPVFSIETVEQVFANERSIYRIFATLFAVLATIGVVLSAIGVYGVIAYAVTQRTQEIGVRVAVGASRWDVTWLFLRKGLVQVAIALAIGLPAAVALGAVARLRLVEIEPHDPVTLVGITLVIAAVALVSCVVPARKAARVDPLTALRVE